MSTTIAEELIRITNAKSTISDELNSRGLDVEGTLSDWATALEDKITPYLSMNITVDVDNVIIDIYTDISPAGEENLEEYDFYSAPIIAYVDGVAYGLSIFDEGEEYKHGLLILPDMAGGEHDVIAGFPGDAKYHGIVVSDNFTIEDIDSSINVRIDPPSPNTSFIVELSTAYDATGEMHFTINNMIYTTEVSSGGWNFVIIPGLPAGTYTYTAEYSGDEDKYKPCQTQGTLTIS